jgi:hypothetical protein
MKRLLLSVVCATLSTCVCPAINARDWSDSTGTYKFEGDLIAASEDTVVVRRKKGDLQAYQIEQLSEDDKAFVKSYLADSSGETDPKEMHTWTGREGFRFRGRVVGYGTRTIVVAHDRGTTTIDKKTMDKLDEIYQLMLPKVIAEYDDESVKTKEDMQKWGRRLRGKDKSFTLDGVRMELANGETIAVPLFLFSPDERKLLEQGWETWKSQETEDTAKRREEFLTVAAAAEYQRAMRAEQQAQTQIQLMQLELLKANSGLTQIWEVQMLPRPGVPARATSVVISAQNSLTARMIAEQQYPAFASAAVRQLNY